MSQSSSSAAGGVRFNLKGGVVDDVAGRAGMIAGEVEEELYHALVIEGGRAKYNAGSAGSSAGGGGGAAEYRRQLRAILFNLRESETAAKPAAAASGGGGSAAAAISVDDDDDDPGAGAASAEVSDWALEPSALLLTPSQLAFNQYPMTPEMHATTEQTMKTAGLPINFRDFPWKTDEMIVF